MALPPANLPEGDRTPPKGIPPVMDPPPRKRKPKPERSGFYIPLWSIILMLLNVGAAAACIIFAVIAVGGRTSTQNNVPVVIILTAAPSQTPEQPPVAAVLTEPAPAIITRQAASSLDLTGPTLVPTRTPTPTPITITLNSTVIVVGNDGINVRTAPGTDQPLSFVANRNEMFLVIEGPETANNLTWWRIRDNAGRSGWAAENDGRDDLMAVYVP